MAFRGFRFQCSSASRKFSIVGIVKRRAASTSFSALQRAENSQFPLLCGKQRIVETVSVLFSEPKILNQFNAPSMTDILNGFSALQRAENSQSRTSGPSRNPTKCFSALQRAENSQCQPLTPCTTSSAVSVLFSEPKILNGICAAAEWIGVKGFSALQRAENSQFGIALHQRPLATEFQCSSASRKFSIGWYEIVHIAPVRSFSALQRAENSQYNSRTRRSSSRAVSVLFSEPKILNVEIEVHAIPLRRVSVLFSEPKILNKRRLVYAASPVHGFSALQRAENSQFSAPGALLERRAGFQCSSASRKFSIRLPVPHLHLRAKWFQCSSASRKFSIRRRPAICRITHAFQCSSASRKFSI